MSEKYKILLVEDEPNLARNIRLNLDMEGYSTEWAGDGQTAINTFKEQKFDLIVLDIMLPGIDGITVCENIRLQDQQIPILFLSAKNMAEDRILGLKKGGDDYMTKPFNLEEFLLRINKLIQRTKGEKTSITELKEFRFGSNYVNFESFEAEGVNGKLTLTKKEALLLKLLIENRNEVVSREKIFQTVWGYSVYPSTRTIDNFILNFRKYFEKDSKNPVYFHSLRGVGYKFSV